MRKLLGSLTFIFIIGLASCGNENRGEIPLTKEQKDSIAQVKLDSARAADSISAIERRKTDSIAQVREAEKKAILAKAKKNFRFNKDEFEDRSWVYHNSTPKYTNRNSVHVYFQQDKDGSASNLRFRIQYEADEWLFIQNVIFNIDGENERFVPEHMETDCGYGGRIWEWCDEPATYNMSLIQKIANAKSVKMKFNGRQYYNTRTMSRQQINAIKETLSFYNALNGI